MAAAADTAPVLPTAEATAETVPCPAIAPARHTQAEADTSRPVLLAVGAPSARAVASTVAAVVNNEFSHVVVRGPTTGWPQRRALTRKAVVLIKHVPRSVQKLDLIDSLKERDFPIK
jgi:leucyl aminopeptidase (aminopeptidase T)